MRGKKSNLCKNFGEEGTPENMSQFLLRSNRTYLKLFESEKQLIISECESFWSCCTTQSKCAINQGDCDNDNECDGSLTCGIRNCVGHLFPENADCCQEPGNQSNIFSMFLENLLKSIGCSKK